MTCFNADFRKAGNAYWVDKKWGLDSDVMFYILYLREIVTVVSALWLKRERRRQGRGVGNGGRGGRDRLREIFRERDRHTDWLTCMIKKVKCQGAFGCDLCSSRLCDAWLAAAISLSLVRDRSLGWCVSKLYFYLSFIDSENSKVVSLLQYNKMLSFKISRCQGEYGLLK